MKKVKQAHGGAIVHAEKGETANPNGRPRKMVSQIIADLKSDGVEPATPSHVSDAISVLLNLSISELKEIGNDTTKPILIQRTAKRLATANERDWDAVIRDNLDRAHGKAKQTMEHQGALTFTQGDELTPERMAALKAAIGE